MGNNVFRSTCRHLFYYGGLQLDTRLAKAEAEERIYSEAMLTLPMSPTKIEMDQENKSNIELQPKSRSLPEINLNPEAPEWATQPNRDKLNSNRHERQSEASSEVAQNFLHNMVDIQLQQQQQAQQMQQVYNEQFQQILSHHQQMTLSMSLPDVQVPTFNGDPIDYCYFVRSFQNLIETITSSDSARLFYLVQYTSGEVQDLVRSCLFMKPEEGYKEARRLLKEKYGENYKIATTYVDRLSQFPPISQKMGTRFSNSRSC